MQGGHRARQQSGRRGTCRRQRTCRRHSPARSCPVEGHPPGDGPPWGSWAFGGHRRLPASPGICPPASSCHLHALRNLLQRPLELPTTSHDHLPSHVPPQKNLRPQTQLFLCCGALPAPAEKRPLFPLPRWPEWGIQFPQACLLGCTRPKCPRALITGTQPAPPGLCPSPPALPTSPTRVFPCTYICEGVPCILSCQSPQQTLGARTPNTVGHTPTHQLEESPAPSHRGQGAGSSLHSRPAKSWRLRTHQGVLQREPCAGPWGGSWGQVGSPWPQRPKPQAGPASCPHTHPCAALTNCCGPARSAVRPAQSQQRGHSLG